MWAAVFPGGGAWSHRMVKLVGLVASYGLDTSDLAVPNGEVGWFAFAHRSGDFFFVKLK